MIMEKRWQLLCWGYIGLSAYYPPIMENHMEKKLENEMDTLGPVKGIHRDTDRGNFGITAKNMDSIIMGYMGSKVQV